jgi:Tol biopolymer transport system component
LSRRAARERAYNPAALPTNATRPGPDADGSGASAGRSAADRLDSWKEIAAHLKRDIRTVQRWEKEHSLPVLRHTNAKQGSVFAYREDVDRWWNARRTELENPSVPSLESRSWRVVGTRGMWIGVTGLAVLAAAVVTAIKMSPSPAPAPTALSVLLDPDVFLDITPGTGKLALSPDGTRLAYVGRNGGDALLYVRRLDRFETTVLRGTDNAQGPSFSPDGRWLAFTTSSDELKRVSVDTGAVVTVCRASRWEGGSAWLPDGRIVFGSRSGLELVSVDGGKPDTLTHVRDNEYSHQDPVVLPGGRIVLFTTVVAGASGFDERIEAQTVGNTGRRTILDNAHLIAYAPNGGLVFERADRVMTARFDPARLTLLSEPVSLLKHADDVVVAGEVLAYAPVSPQRHDHRLVWVHPDGKEEAIDAPPRPYMEPSLSPDGRRIALKIEEGNQTQVWIYDIERSSLGSLTTEGHNRLPFWNKDGSLVAFNSTGTTSGGKGGFVTKAQVPDGSSPAMLLTSVCAWGSFSSDNTLWCTGDRTFLKIPNGGRGTPHTVLQGPAMSSPRISPDDRWVAYESEQTGRWEVFVASLTDPRARWQVSTNGGGEMAWGRSLDRNVLFFRANGKLMRATIEVALGAATNSIVPEALFDDVYVPNYPALPNFDVAPDGRFLMIKGERSDRVAEIRVQRGWMPSHADR